MRILRALHVPFVSLASVKFLVLVHGICETKFDPWSWLWPRRLSY